MILDFKTYTAVNENEDVFRQPSVIAKCFEMVAKQCKDLVLTSRREDALKLNNRKNSMALKALMQCDLSTDITSNIIESLNQIALNYVESHFAEFVNEQLTDILRDETPLDFETCLYEFFEEACLFTLNCFIVFYPTEKVDIKIFEDTSNDNHDDSIYVDDWMKEGFILDLSNKLKPEIESKAEEIFNATVQSYNETQDI